jgi:hypothetical protein
VLVVHRRDSSLNALHVRATGGFDGWEFAQEQRPTGVAAGKVSDSQREKQEQSPLTKTSAVGVAEQRKLITIS